MCTGSWLSLALLLLSTAVEANVRCDCHKAGLTYTRLTITCDRDRKAGGEVICNKEKHGAVVEGYDVFKSPTTERYESLYRLYRTGRDWRAANAACQRDGGHLAVFDDQSELGYLATLLEKETNSRTSRAAVGLRRFSGREDYHPITGKPLGQLVSNNWGAGEPYDAPDRLCLTLNLLQRGGFYLSNHDCGEPEIFICERPLSPPVPVSYSFSRGIGFYKTSEKYLPYERAEAECVKNGGHLVVPDTQKEADILLNIFDMFPDVQKMYVGVADRSGTGDFSTIHGGRLSSLAFQNWAPHALENRTTQPRCVAMTSLGLYQLVDCALPLPTICEWPLR